MQHIIYMAGHFNQVAWLATAGSMQTEAELLNKQKQDFSETLILPHLTARTRHLYKVHRCLHRCGYRSHALLFLMAS